MAEDDINPRPDDIEDEEEDNEATSAEEQRILDELTQFGDGEAPLEDVEDQVDAFGGDDDNPEPALSQSMSTIHTGSQLTNAEILAGLPPTGEVLNPLGEMSALQEEPSADPEVIQPPAYDPQYDRRPDETGGQDQQPIGPAGYAEDTPDE